MEINNVIFDAELVDILSFLKTELFSTHSKFLNKIRPSGNNIMVCCPYHKNGQEKNPSAGISTKDGTFHCFTCQIVATLPEMISYCFGYDDNGSFGWNWLLQNFATIEKENRPDVRIDCARNMDVSRNVRGSKTNSETAGENRQNIDANLARSGEDWEEELNHYRYFHPYMYQRGLTNFIISMFDIGFDRNSNSITFPIKDIEGNVLFIGRRNVKTKFYNYPSGVAKPVYGLYECMYLLPKEWTVKKIYITEGPFDMWIAWKYGCAAVSLLGLGTEFQFRQLLQFPCRQYVLATDMDEAGLNARKRIRKVLGGHKILTELLLPDGIKDIGECSEIDFNNAVEVF